MEEVRYFHSVISTTLLEIREDNFQNKFIVRVLDPNTFLNLHDIRVLYPVCL